MYFYLAFWGCQSSPVMVTVVIKPSITLNCPQEVLAGSTYACSCEIYGSMFNDVRMKRDVVTTYFNVTGGIVSFIIFICIFVHVYVFMLIW